MRKAGRGEWLLACLVVALIALPLASAAPALQVVPDRLLDQPLPVQARGTLQLGFTVANLGDGAVLLVRAEAPDGWNATALPSSMPLPNGSQAAPRAVEVVVRVPEDARPGQYPLRVAFAAVAPDGSVAEEVHDLTLALEHNPLVLGLWENPLPGPLDGWPGVLLLDVLFWTLVALLLLALQGPLVRGLGRREDRMAVRVAQRIRVPLVMLLLVLGLTASLQAVPPGPIAVNLGRLLHALALLVVMVLGYRAFQGALEWYGTNVAARTASQLDDVLCRCWRRSGPWSSCWPASSTRWPRWAWTSRPSSWAARSSAWCWPSRPRTP
jgi:hypothetical protein